MLHREAPHLFSPAFSFALSKPILEGLPGEAGCGDTGAAGFVEKGAVGFFRQGEVEFFCLRRWHELCLSFYHDIMTSIQASSTKPTPA
ncbi:MAG: hypothetical protein DRQ47_08765 [Gammaproteobacteria bacterium]|nr:MAG: hypothetical protein DRQ47_08765 [Gammaproteobacteria bacterium]